MKLFFEKNRKNKIGIFFVFQTSIQLEIESSSYLPTGNETTQHANLEMDLHRSEGLCDQAQIRHT